MVSCSDKLTILLLKKLTLLELKVKNSLLIYNIVMTALTWLIS